jgi:cystathionine beta-lyase
MPFDFDTPIDRSGGDSVKWNKYRGRDILPLWVADMDFAAPPAVLEALHRRVEHGVFGYAEPWPSLFEAVQAALMRDYAWAVQREWIIWLPGLVSGLNVTCRAIGAPGDQVLTATPIYPPFLSAPRYSQREVIAVPMRLQGTRWQWDLERAEAAVGPRTRLLMLCNPHNPVGRVFTREELLGIAALCERHDLVLCSDEIHCGLVLDPDSRHLPVAALDGAIAQRTITLMAASKTYNLPGLGCAFAIIPGNGLRQRFIEALRGIVPHVNALGMAATEAAYRDCTGWHVALIEYLRGNRDRVLAGVGALPGLSATPIEATYLAWIDCRALGQQDPGAFLEAGGVGMSNGSDFGAPGYVRLNFGCPRATLDEALRRMAKAVAGRS